VFRAEQSLRARRGKGARARQAWQRVAVRDARCSALRTARVLRAARTQRARI